MSFALYTTLGLTRNATEQDIKRSYRLLAVEKHPDKGGDAAAFQQINHAYSVLSNPASKRQYDLSGSEEPASQQMPHHMFENLFQRGRHMSGMEFMHSNNNNRGNEKPVPVNTKISLPVTLEEVYTGCTKVLSVKRKVKCTGCDGKRGDTVKCVTCDGRGKVRQVVHNAFFMQEAIHVCPACNGTAVTVTKACLTCAQTGTTMMTSDAKVVIPKGLTTEEPLVLKDMGDWKDGHTSLELRLNVQSHGTFVRDKYNLHVTHNVTLYEALTGIRFRIKHLDGITYHLQYPTRRLPCVPGSTIHKAEWGLPVWKRDTHYGHMIITFTVTFPMYTDVSLKTCVEQYWPEKYKGVQHVDVVDLEELPSPR